MKKSKCPVCYNKKKLSIKYKCNTHKICNDCFAQWHKKNKTCPICRSVEIGFNNSFQQSDFNLITITEEITYGL